MRRWLLLFAVLFPLRAVAGASLMLGYIADSAVRLDTPGTRYAARGDGFSVQGSFDLARGGFFYADHHRRDAHGSARSGSLRARLGTRLRTTRFGVGMATGSRTGALWAGLNWEQLALGSGGRDSSGSGYGLRAGATFPLGKRVYLFGEGGWAALDESQSWDLAVGAGLYLHDRLSAIADYRHQRLMPDDQQGDFEIRDLRVGLRWTLTH